MTGKLLTDAELNLFENAHQSDGLEELFDHICALTEKLRESEAGAAALREALEAALDLETNPWTSVRTDDVSRAIFESYRKTLSSVTAGRDLLERLRKAEADVEAESGRANNLWSQTRALMQERDSAIKRAEESEEERDICLFELNRIEAIPDVSQCLHDGEVADAVQAAIDDLEEERDSAIKRAESAEARVRELERELRDTIDCAGSLNIKLAISDSKLRVAEKRSEAAMPDPVHSALEKCVPALEQAALWMRNVANTVEVGFECLKDIDDALRAARDTGVGA